MAKRRVPPAPGQTFGRWTVLARAETRRQGRGASAGTRPYWLCRCACGVEREVSQQHLFVGLSLSCGCRQREIVTSHGLHRMAEYVAWAGMMTRCYNQSDAGYPRYGGRGISVCHEWRDGPGAFIAYVGPRPSPEHSIDRIDNDGPYAPGNVRWATRREQAQNRGSTLLYTYDGVTRPLCEWTRALGFGQTTIRDRLAHGWSIEQALTLPVGTYIQKRGRPKRRK